MLRFTGRPILLLLLGLAMMASTPPPAEAQYWREFEFCNREGRDRVLIATAVRLEFLLGWRSAGWFGVNPGGCVEIKGAPGYENPVYFTFVTRSPDRRHIRFHQYLVPKDRSTSRGVGEVRNVQQKICVHPLHPWDMRGSLSDLSNCGNGFTPGIFTLFAGASASNTLATIRVDVSGIPHAPVLATAPRAGDAPPTNSGWTVASASQVMGPPSVRDGGRTTMGARAAGTGPATSATRTRDRAAEETARAEGRREERLARAARHERSCRAGQASACGSAGVWYALVGQSERALEMQRLGLPLQERDCKNGDWDACVSVGETYERGRVVPENFVQGMAHYEQAIDILYRNCTAGRDGHACHMLAGFFNSRSHPWKVRAIRGVLNRGEASYTRETLLQRACSLGSSLSCQYLREGR